MNVILICVLVNIVFSVNIKSLSDEKVDPLFHVGGNSANIDSLVPSDGILVSGILDPSLKSSNLSEISKSYGLPDFMSINPSKVNSNSSEISKSYGLPDFLSQMLIGPSKVNGNSSEISKFHGISHFLSQLSLIDPNKVKPIEQYIRRLVIQSSEKIKAFKSILVQAKIKLDKAIEIHKVKKDNFDITEKRLSEAATKHKAALSAHHTSTIELRSATLVKIAAEVKYKDAKAAYETNEPDLQKKIVSLGGVIAEVDQMSKSNLVKVNSNSSEIYKSYILPDFLSQMSIDPSKVNSNSSEISKSYGLPDFLSQMSIDPSKVNGNSSEISKFHGISNFLSQLSLIDTNNVNTIDQMLRVLANHYSEQIKAFKSTLDQAKIELDKAIEIHKVKKNNFDITEKRLREAEIKHNATLSAHHTSTKELGDATEVKIAAEAKYKDAKAAYETKEPELQKDIVFFGKIIAILDQMSFNLVRHISSRANTNKAFWKTVCGKYGDVTVNSVMKIKMGVYIDYFKPVKTMSFCHFLLSQRTFQWSTEPLGPYIEPKYYPRPIAYGGADSAWSKNNAGGRSHLPFWGVERNGNGGCCVGKAGQSTWYLSFDMYLSKGYFGFLPSFVLVRIVGGRDTTNKAYWNAVCGKYGDVTVNSVMRIKMGTYIDYFKPVKTMSFCNFLLTQYSFQWSAKPSGPYVRPKYYPRSTTYGGADSAWSKANAGGRVNLPFWGFELNAHGGCCVGYAGRSQWYQPFEMHLSKTYIK